LTGGLASPLVERVEVTAVRAGGALRRFGELLDRR
jgi:hypothetical protein